MKKLILSLAFILNCTACDTLTSWFGDDTQKSDALYDSIKDMYDAYNKKQLDRYVSFFSKDINVFKEQGLGNIRIISGKDQFKGYYERVFIRKKTLRLTPLEHFSVPPWVMVKELIEADNEFFEAAVGYRILDGKIIDRMILSERLVVKKEQVTPSLPKESSNPIPVPFDVDKNKLPAN